MTAKRIRPAPRPRQRILDAAYDLFCANGINQVGIDTILAELGCAKASLYGNFNSKADLAVAFLDRREIVWTRAWLETEIKRRASNPKARLLAIFDVFDGWFHKTSFEGYPFRAIIHGLAQEADLQDPGKFAQIWPMLMKGSIVSARKATQRSARG